MIKYGVWKQVFPVICDLVWEGYECSECGYTIYCEPQEFCPNCGAKMEGEND